MKKAFLPTLLVIAAFFAGRYLFPSSETTAPADGEPDETALGIHQSSRRRTSSSGGQTASERQLDPGEVPAALYQDLLIADYFESHRAIMNRLAQMDASNWQEMLEQFQKVTRETGIRHDEIWPNVLQRIGQVAGREAIDRWMADDPTKYRFHMLQAMWGWSMTDPAGVIAYYPDLATLDPKFRNEMFSRMIGGLALTNHEELLRFVSTLPEEEQNLSVGHSVWNLMKGGGIERTNRWLDDVQNGSFPERMKSNSFQQVAQAIIKNMRGLGAQSGIEWFQRYQNSPHLSKELIADAASSFRNENTLQSLEFLKTAVDFPVLSDVSENPPGLTAAVLNSTRHDRTEVERWLQENQNAPFYKAARSFFEGDTTAFPQGE